MSTTTTGDATAVSTYLSRTVTGATNATPIVITTSANHLFETDDWVVVASVGGNTAANGLWKIIRLSATTFSLTSSVGNGAYTSGGTAADISCTPQFTIPADGDDLDAASVNVALEALADRTQYLARQTKNRVDVFTASGTWTCPENVFAVDLEGCGGGAGGGTGGTGTASTDRWPPGGSGGGAAPLVKKQVAVTPGTAYTVTIGAGGATDTDGDNTTFDALATFVGGGKGGSATGVSSISAGTVMVCMPGTIRGVTHPAALYTPTSGTVEQSNGLNIGTAPGNGGNGLGSNGGVNAPSRAGMPSATGYAGGAAGAHGAASGSYRGGGGGGGGGGGPYGVGGAGATGPAGNGAGAGTAGSAGSAAAANTGAGGGGGSSGSNGTSGTPAGGAGGAGGSGQLSISYVGHQAVVA